MRINQFFICWLVSFFICAQQPKNIVLLMTDDISLKAFSVYGNRNVQLLYHIPKGLEKEVNLLKEVIYNYPQLDESNPII